MKLLDLLTSPWALQPAKLHEMQSIYATHLRGEKIDLAAIEARLGRPLASEQQEYTVGDGGIATLRIEGVVAPKANLLTRVSGGVSAEMARRQIESAVADSRVKGLVLQIDSPGGSVNGTPELAQAVREMAAVKPIVAVSDGVMASAAYWIGSAANAVFVTGPTVQVGSIGVVATHEWDPRSHPAGGLRTEIVAGRYKRVASDMAPLTEEGRAYLQSQVDALYGVFVEAVAAHRGVSADQVLAHMADGRVWIGQQAVDRGLVDGIRSIDRIAADMASDPTAFMRRRRARIAAGVTAAEQPTVRITSSDTAVVGDESVKAGVVSVGATHTASEGAAQEMNRADLETQSPTLFAELRAEFMAAGADAERERIKAVAAQSLPGHEALIKALMFDGKTTGHEAATTVLAAERSLRGRAAADLAADAPQPVPQVAAQVFEAGAADQAATLPLEQRCEAQWSADPKLRGEFSTLAAFTAYVRASESGQARIFRK